jgi:hypothetical protein
MLENSATAAAPETLDTIQVIAVPFRRAAPKLTGHSYTRLRAAVREKRLTIRRDGKARIVEVDELRRYVRSLPTIGRAPEATAAA